MPRPSQLPEPHFSGVVFATSSPVRGRLTPHDAESLRLVQWELRRKGQDDVVQDQQLLRDGICAARSEWMGGAWLGLCAGVASLQLAEARALLRAALESVEEEERLRLTDARLRSSASSRATEQGRLTREGMLEHAAQQRFARNELLRAEAAAREDRRAREEDCRGALARAHHLESTVCVQSAPGRALLAAHEQEERAPLLPAAALSARTVTAAAEQHSRAALLRRFEDGREALSRARRMADAVASAVLQRAWRRCAARRLLVGRRLLSRALAEHRWRWECDLLDEQAAARVRFVGEEEICRGMVRDAEGPAREGIESAMAAEPIEAEVRRAVARELRRRSQEIFSAESGARSEMDAVAVAEGARMLRLSMQPLHRTQRNWSAQYEYFGREQCEAAEEAARRAVRGAALAAGAELLHRREGRQRSDLGAEQVRAACQVAVRGAALLADGAALAAVAGARRRRAAAAIAQWWRQRPWRDRRLSALREALRPSGRRGHFARRIASAAASAAARELAYAMLPTQGRPVPSP